MSTQEQDNSYLNRKYTEVSSELLTRKVPFRCWKVDGVYMILTMDLKLDRLNFEVQDDIIIEVHRG